IGQYPSVNNEVDMERLTRVAAIEIRFGQGAYPGRESYLPAEKLTKDISSIKGIKGSESIYSPAHHYDLTSPSKINPSL
ncbi:MAG: glutamate synthase-related protein, partial [Kangiellaceae bacterium]|nr:glutamate synthase-related protein [Kangiellaceae bacterium]